MNTRKTDTHGPALLAMSTVNRNAIVTSLSRSGWKVVGARGFENPLDRLGETDAAGIIVDLRDDGVAALAAIRALAGQASILAIVPGRDIKWITAAIDAGATHYLTSPFPQVELAQAVRLLVADRSTGRAVPATGAGLILEGTRATGEIERRLKGGRVSALLIAATRFEAVNAAYGREVGDELLGAVAQRIATAVRDVDPMATVAKVSGAEFAVLVGAGTGKALADDVCARIDRPFMVGGHFVSVGCRIGVVENKVGEDAATLLRRASAALAEARLSDTSAIHAIGAEDSGEALFDATLESDLRSALDNNEIELLFQPQVDISSGRAVGVEALARWRHPDHGDLGAATLFAVAARSEYLVTLSNHVQIRALEMAASWPSALGHLRLSINITANDIASPAFAEGFLSIVEASGFDRYRLTVEITESGLIDNLGVAAATFARLRSAGIRVAIDDFGTGYSSLAWLKSLPLDYLKIDKDLAQDIAGSARDRVVVRGVIDMARSLGLSVIAEGVETEEQLGLLAAEGCNYYQGFLFAEPLSVEDLIIRMTFA
ncbi:MAG: bifunctional diguanylate cyclase/phosphodiesterase [Sphingomonadales bacterium]